MFKSAPFKDIDIPASRAYAEARRAGIIGGGARRRKAKGADSTIRRELVVLNAAANHAARWKRISRDDLPSIELPSAPRVESISDDDWLTKAELSGAIDAATGRLRDFILIAYYTGGRRASIERLTKFQVSLERSQINLRGPHETPQQRRSTKRRPMVPIDPAIRSTVERLMRESPSEWLFGDPRNVYRPFRELMKSLGLSAKSNPHILRHSRATHLLQDGISIYVVARLLGDSVATVERVYGHCSVDFMQEAIQGKPI